MAYSMGQHLYNAKYLPGSNHDPANPAYLVKKNTVASGVRLGGTNYRDLKITPSLEDSTSSKLKPDPDFEFKSGLSYLLRLRIRRNVAYSLEVDLKLMNESNSGSETSTTTLNEQKYEEIQRIYIPRAENFQHTSSVVLYESQEEDKSQENKNEFSNNKVYAGVLRTTQDSCGYYDVYYDKEKKFDQTSSYYYYKNPLNDNINDSFTKIDQRSIVNLPHT